jgi:protein phosphatase
MVVQAAGITDVGKVRGRNEDAYLISDNLFVVADGLGGYRGGEKASRMAVDGLLEYISVTREVLSEKTPERIEGIIRNAIHHVNKKIYETGVKQIEYAGMGCTCALAWWQQPQTLHIANVGDARVYLFQNTKVQQLTKDHSVVGDLVRTGQLTADMIRFHPQRNVVTQALGIRPAVELYYATIPVFQGDRLLLCTDGLWEMVLEKEMVELFLRQQQPDLLCTELVKKANDMGGYDNMTAIVVDIRTGARSGRE